MMRRITPSLREERVKDWIIIGEPSVISLCEAPLRKGVILSGIRSLREVVHIGVSVLQAFSQEWSIPGAIAGVLLIQSQR